MRCVYTLSGAKIESLFYAKKFSTQKNQKSASREKTESSLLTPTPAFL